MRPGAHGYIKSWIHSLQFLLRMHVISLLELPHSPYLMKVVSAGFDVMR